MAALSERPRSDESQASSLLTISSINTSFHSKPLRVMKKVHSFAKRDQAVKRDPNSVTVIRGWLYKQDSSGLKLWKRRWFVLSDFCLFYYRDSREERILGSIPMPSYIISAEPQDRKTRKFTFKAEHPGMRTYRFSADTQEDMNGWIRALTQSARVETENTNISLVKAAKRLPQEQRCSSFEDFTKSGFLDLHGKALGTAKQPEPRRQSNSRNDKMEKKLQQVQQELLSPTNGQRDDPPLTISVQQLTPPPQHGTVPPPTPTNGFQNRTFRFERSTRPGEEITDPERRSSLSHVEQWVRSQEEKLPEEQEDDGHLVLNSESGHVYEYLVDGYPILPANSRLHREHSISLSSANSQQQFPGYHPHQERRFQPETSSPISMSQCRVFPSNTPDLISSRSIRSLRSNSLPVTSDTPRYQVLRRSHTPDDRYLILSEGQRCHFSETPSDRISQGSLDRVPITPNWPVASKPPVPFYRSSQSAQSPSERSEHGSHEDILRMSSSQKTSRSVMRPHTPVGRIDIFPTPQLTPVVRNSYLQISEPLTGSHSLPVNVTLLANEEQPGEYYIAQGQTMKNIYSRPQRHSALPSEEHYTFLPNRSQGPFRMQQRSPTPSERLTVVPLNEGDVESLNLTIPNRRSGNYRSPTPVERFTVFSAKDHYKEMSLGRQRIPGIRESLTHQNRRFPPLPSHTSRTISTLRLSGKLGARSSCNDLPPRPPSSPRTNSKPMLSTVRRLSLTPSTYGEYTSQTVKTAENEIDLLLTKLCGQDRLLQGLVTEATQLKAEKEKLEGVWEITHRQMMDFERQPNIVEQLTFQQRILQEDLIQIRARLCDLSMELQQSWAEYEFLESELQRFRSSRELLTNCGTQQERVEAQRDLWMIEDVILGLSNNRKSFQSAIGSTHQSAMFTVSPGLHFPSECQSDSQQIPLGLSPLPSPTRTQPLTPGEVADVIPSRPPLPHSWPQSEQNPPEHLDTKPVFPATPPEQKHTQRQSDSVHSNPVTSANHKGQHSVSIGGVGRKGKMSAEEQMERMKRHLEGHLHQKPRAGLLSQRSVAVSPIMRGTLTGTPRVNSASLLTNRPVTNHSTGAHLTASEMPSRTRPGNSPTAPTTPAPGPGGGPTVTASSKLVTKISAPETAENHDRKRTCRPSKVVISTRYTEADSETPLSAEQLQEKQRTVEKIKTMIAKASPDVAGSCDRSMQLRDRERERIINLSYTLANEASQRSKVLAAKALAELQKQEELMDNQNIQNETTNQSSSLKHQLVFNFQHHKESTNPCSGSHRQSTNPCSGQNSQRERTNQYLTKENIPTNQSLTLEIESANLKLGEQKDSPNLDSAEEMEGLSLTGRALADVTFIVEED